MSHSLSKATLLLAYHGATDDPGPARAGASLVSKIQATGLFGAVHVGFYKQSPYMHDILNASKSNLVYILPMLMSAGFFAREAFPRFLKIQEDGISSFPYIHKTGEKTIVYTQSLGSLRGISDLVLQTVMHTLNANASSAPVTPSEINLALVGHGTPRHSKSKETTQLLVETLNQTKYFRSAKGFFIEEAPFVEEILDWKTEGNHCVVVPFMAADGPHTTQDIPSALRHGEGSGKEQIVTTLNNWKNPTLHQDKHIWITPPIGLSPLLPELIIQYLKDLAASLPPGIDA